MAPGAGAQNVTGAAADAAAGNSSHSGASVNSGGIAPVGALNTSVSPLSLNGSLSPTLAAPAPNLNQGLAKSAMVPSLSAAASASEEKKPAAAAAAAPVPPHAPPDGAAAASPPSGGPPARFIVELLKLGVPVSLTTRLYNFLGSRHPGDQNAVYHGLGHSREVANLTAAIVSQRGDLTPEQKILLIFSGALHDVDPERAENTPARVAATLEHLDKDDEARGLLVDFGSRYGFTAAQVKAMIMATDFAPDKEQMDAKQAAFAKAAKEAFPNGADWALEWGKRLAFADQSSTYVGSVEEAKKRVKGLALEIRTQLAALGKQGPSDEVILAGSFKFLNVLRQNELFALLPAEQRGNFVAVQNYFEQRQTPEAWSKENAPAPARAPPVNPDVAEARKFIMGIMGKRAPTEREADSLLGDWLDENGIDRDSPRATAVRAQLVPQKAELQARVAAAVKPELRRHAAMLIRVATAHKTTVAAVQGVIERRGLLEHAGIPADQYEHQVEMAMTADELARAVVNYPKNDAGNLMRGVASAMSTRSGKSVEEVARDGVFLYADFMGDKFLRGYASRDPDIQSNTIAFYITHVDGKWKIDGYRQSKSGRLSDAAYITSLKKWLLLGGIPERDLR